MDKKHPGGTIDSLPNYRKPVNPPWRLLPGPKSQAAHARMRNSKPSEVPIIKTTRLVRGFFSTGRGGRDCSRDNDVRFHPRRRARRCSTPKTAMFGIGAAGRRRPGSGGSRREKRRSRRRCVRRGFCGCPPSGRIGVKIRPGQARGRLPSPRFPPE
jgi:hypothetical protein